MMLRCSVLMVTHCTHAESLRQKRPSRATSGAAVGTRCRVQLHRVRRMSNGSLNAANALTRRPTQRRVGAAPGQQISGRQRAPPRAAHGPDHDSSATADVNSSTAATSQPQSQRRQSPMAEEWGRGTLTYPRKCVIAFT